MRSITRTKNLIIALILGIVCMVAGLFFYEKKASDVVTASAYESIGETYIDGFYMAEGMALRTVPDEPFCRFTVNVSEEMANNLSKKTTVNSLFFGAYKEYIPSDYYLSITRSADGQEDYVVNYHIDPDNARIGGSTGLIVQGTTCYLMFPINTDFETEYTYYCEYFSNDRVYKEEPIYGGGYYTRENTLRGVSSTTVTRSVGNVARKVLEAEGDRFTDKELQWVKHLAGYNNSSDLFTVNVHYKDVIEYGKIETLIEQVQINSLYCGSSSLVYSEVERILGFYGIHNFNVTYKDNEGRPIIIILQADSYTYTYDEQTEVGELTIEYRGFDYKNFAIRIQDNDPENATDLYFYKYATNVSQSSDSTRIYLDFNFSEIESLVFAKLSWIFSIKQSNVNIVNNSEYIDVIFTDNGLRVSFMPSYENELVNVSVLVLAEIIPDFSCDVQVKYSSLSFANGTIVETQETENRSMMYSAYIQLSNFSIFKESVMYERVTSALQVAELGKQEYFIPYNLEAKKNADGSFTLQMVYRYNMLLQITDETNGTVHFVACTANSLTYNINQLGIAANAGYRIKSLTSEDPSVTINFDEGNTSSLSVTVNVNTNQKKIIPISLKYSDIWNLNIVYMETYKDTPFALQKVETKQIKVSEYNPKSMTLKEIKRLLGRTDDMKVCGISLPDEKVKTELTSDSTYTATLSYGVCSINQIDYNGNTQEIRVPLTSFADWAKTFGDEDLTILALNREEQYFEYSNDVDREKLYGFFSMAVFEEQVLDFNYYFRNNTGAGNMVMFEQREVTGSSVYQFFGNLRDKGPLASISGHVGMAYCEILNDDNKILHSVFFYMDATEGYISDGGADDKNDTDGAFENTTQDVVDKVEDLWDEMSDGMETVRIAIAAVLGLALAGGIAFGVIWLIKYYKKKE